MQLLRSPPRTPAGCPATRPTRRPAPAPRVAVVTAATGSDDASQSADSSRRAVVLGAALAAIGARAAPALAEGEGSEYYGESLEWCACGKWGWSRGRGAG
jgi:hypothetical protein